MGSDNSSGVGLGVSSSVEICSATSLRLHLNVATVLPVATLTSALYDLYCINDVRDLGGLAIPLSIQGWLKRVSKKRVRMLSYMAHNNGLAISRIIRGEAIQSRSADWLHQGCELRCSVLSIARLHAQRYHLGDHARSRYNLQHMGSATACPVCWSGWTNSSVAKRYSGQAWAG